ncbi:translation factor GUF1, mitochondrial [Artemisia annua]|uniref:Translation factor GUF1, mitochondrial n=1 Tax=Artemisia annua TaxID=35608 RepID=A0A2U1QCJ6_ARTAN|nr:translation factor GUF1, mitochondrial [Artemisia annua]
MSAATGQSYEILDVRILQPELRSTRILLSGQVGYVVSSMRSTKEAHIGDTMSDTKTVVDRAPTREQRKKRHQPYPTSVRSGNIPYFLKKYIIYCRFSNSFGSYPLSYTICICKVEKMEINIDFTANTTTIRLFRSYKNFHKVLELSKQYGQVLENKNQWLSRLVAVIVKTNRSKRSLKFVFSYILKCNYKNPFSKILVYEAQRKALDMPPTTIVEPTNESFYGVINYHLHEGNTRFKKFKDICHIGFSTLKSRVETL